MRGHFLFFIVISCQLVPSWQQCDWNTCHECISDPKMCVWCSSEKFVLDNRCRPASVATEESWCILEDIQNPKSNVTVVTFQDFNSTFGHMIQLKPQKFHLDIRVGEPLKFNFSYKAADNFPVDVYFLLDVSKSTEFFKDDLLKQSKNIFNTMRTLTKDVYMGLGTFIDKNMLPFQANVIANESYSFKHQLSLTNNMTAFHSILNGTTFGSNYDHPESGLDGIAQVIACKDQINWRNHSRKILVHLTDASFHSAGDGLNAGIEKPYDGGCYLDDKGFYMMEKEMDYPSLGIINKMASDEQISIFFVSSLTDESVYDNLKKAVAGSFYESYREEAITSRLKEIYESISLNIVLRVNMTSQYEKYLKITFEPECGETFNDKEACTVDKGEEKHFTGTIVLSKYFGEKHLNLGINPTSLKEDIALDINVITNCGCDVKMKKNSSACSYAGDRNCGVCECYEDKFGPTCSCSDAQSECKPNGTDTECGGHGSCICGTCNCYNGYTGKFCQILTSNCQRGIDGTLCSERGTCSDGQCACDAGWSGPACECSESIEGCFENKMECSNRGKCRCGACSCYEPSKWDVRSYDKTTCGQASCVNCHKKQCRKLIPCIRCHYESDQCEDTCGGNLTVVKFAEVPEELRSEWNVCSSMRMDFGCYANFSYIYNDNHTITLFVLNEKNCQESQFLIGVISAAVLILIGILTLVAWKLLTTIRDRREYQQFLKAAEEMECEEINEVYKAPTTTYLNPAFQTCPNDKAD